MCGGLVSKNFRTSPAGDRYFAAVLLPRAIKTGKEVLSEFLVRAFPARALTLSRLHAPATSVATCRRVTRESCRDQAHDTFSVSFNSKSAILSLTPHASVDDNNEREGPN